MSDVSNTPTVIDFDVTPSGSTHEEGWLTAESYVDWVQGTSGLMLGERPFAQPPAFVYEDEDDNLIVVDTIAA